MATYTELYDLYSDASLRNKITVAVTKKAQSLIDSATPTAAQVTWAQEAIQQPAEKAETLFKYVLAKNSTLTVAQIKGATDSAIQSQIDAAVDVLIAGGS